MKLFTMLSVLAATSMAEVPEALPDSPEFTVSGLGNASSYGFLPKTVISSRLRLIIAVGLEGTGHEYFCQVDDDLFNKNPELVRLPSEYNLNIGEFHIRSSMGHTVQHYSTAIDRAKTAMRLLVQGGAELPSSGLVMYIHGKYSYPDGMGLNKVLMYLDLRLLAEVAEAEGVDFRVVYLRRPVKDMLVANTVHRGFQNALGQTGQIHPEKRFMEYMQVLITDIAVVHSFLAELDPAFVICHDFERTGELEQSASISRFLAPNYEVAEMLKHSLIDVASAHGPSTEDLPYAGSDAVVARLQRKVDTFESTVCTPLS